MRPKVVILILGIGVGLVAVVVLLKGVTGGRPSKDTPVVSTGEPTNQEPPAVTTVQDVQVNPNSSNTAAIVEQLRADAVQKELDLINELQAEGASSPATTPVLLAKVTHPEAEVRKAAVEALVQLNDTNAVPGLEQAVELIKDPREKVAMLDAIAYLKLPNITPEVQPAMDDTANNPAETIKPKRVITNPNFKRGGRYNGRQAAPPAAPQTSPSGQPQ
jgi:HEAT repeat protein